MYIQYVQYGSMPIIILIVLCKICMHIMYNNIIIACFGKDYMNSMYVHSLKFGVPNLTVFPFSTVVESAISSTNCRNWDPKELALFCVVRREYSVMWKMCVCVCVCLCACVMLCEL